MPERSFTRTELGDVTIPFTVVNVGSDTVEFSLGCFDHFASTVERRAVLQWEQYASQICPAVVMAASRLRLGPGESRSDAMSVFSSGEFRIVLTVENRSIASDVFTVH